MNIHSHLEKVLAWKWLTSGKLETKVGTGLQQRFLLDLYVFRLFFWWFDVNDSQECIPNREPKKIG